MWLFIAFALIVVISIVYSSIFLQLGFYNNSSLEKHKGSSVSILVCAKNESENLKKLIPRLLSQNHPSFEIILINDASTDDTLEVMEHFAENHPSIKLVNVKSNENFWGNKKYALTLGIKKASYTNLLFIDADCTPNSNNWISLMTYKLNTENQIFLGYGPYLKEKGLLNKLIRFETLLTAIQYFGFALKGMPYMGVGRNLAYKKELFFKNNGFINHIKIASGDDDLFINENATKTNTAICVEEESFTYSIAKKTFKDWLIQKKRHTTTAKYYKQKHQIILVLFYLCNLLFWIFTILCFVFADWKIALSLFTLRVSLYYFSLYKGALKLKENDLVLWFPILEICLIAIHLSIFISNLFKSPKRWK